MESYRLIKYAKGVTYFFLPYFKRLVPKAGNSGGKIKKRYADIISAFDIETTKMYRYPDGYFSFMYIWQLCIGDIVIVGRTWNDFLDFIDELEKLLHGLVLVVWVHNLSYEFQFLKGIYRFRNDEVFAVKSRRVLKADMKGCIEFRCSYLHSNLSLDEYLKQRKVDHLKRSGEDFNYSKIRYPNTLLSKDELEYAVYDVIGLCEAIKIDLDAYGDDLYTIPLTSTGYVRRKAKHSLKHSRVYIKTLFPDLELWPMLRFAFRGGDSHANRFYVGRIIDHVYSEDRSSSYPDVMVNDKFPMRPFEKISKEVTEEEINHIIDKRGKPLLMKMQAINLKLQDEIWGNPYLPLHKSLKIREYINDNGRILEASYCSYIITDIDWKIIREQYKFEDVFFSDVHISSYGYLPKDFRELIISLYQDKTSLKGIPEKELQYMKSKEEINSAYGMMVQNMLKPELIFDGVDFYEKESTLEEMVNFANKKMFMPYQWGVWVTAWARYWLYQGIKIAGYQHVYNDTDSVKHIGEVDFSKLNDFFRERSIKSGAYAKDSKGNVHYMGVYESDGTYSQFKTLGSKKYAYIEDEKLKVTISGVSKKKGGEELQEKGGLAALKEGFIFRKGGGTDIKYNDGFMGILSYPGGYAPITSNAVIIDSTYEIGLTGEYKELLEYCKERGIM